MALPEDRIISVYRHAYALILQTLRSLGPSMLGTIRGILDALVTETKAWIEEEVPKAYQEGQSVTQDALRATGEGPEGSEPPESRGAVHRSSVEALAESLYEDLTDSVQLVGRRVRDALREAGLEAALQGQSQGESRAEIQQRIEGLIAERGLAGFVDKAGREWRPDAYAAMLARTTLAEARNLGIINQLEEVGEDLGQITRTGTPCEICARYEGRVYSISGRDKRFPSLRSTALSVAFHTIHPNCKHQITPYIEEFADDVAADIQDSNRPFEDDRSEAQKRAYDEGQTRKRRAREKRKAALA